MNLIKIFLLKDLKVEFKEKTNFFYILILLSTFTLIVTTYFKHENPLNLYFLIFLIIHFFSHQRISRQEIGTSDDLIVFNLPIDLSLFCIAKILFSTSLFFVINIFLFLLYNLLTQEELINLNYGFFLFSFIFSIGINSILTSFSLLLERIKGEGHFMFILIFPLILPFIFLSFNSISDLYSMNFYKFISSFNFQILFAFDILLFALCPILFSYALRR